MANGSGRLEVSMRLSCGVFLACEKVCLANGPVPDNFLKSMSSIRRSGALLLVASFSRDAMLFAVCVGKRCWGRAGVVVEYGVGNVVGKVREWCALTGLL